MLRSDRTREGSPWTGLWAVVAKDTADHLTSTRMLILELLILLTGGVTALSAAWLFFTIFWNILVGVMADAFGPQQALTMQDLLSRAGLIQTLSRISPNPLFVEATVGLLNPATRSFPLGWGCPTSCMGLCWARCFHSARACC